MLIEANAARVIKAVTNTPLDIPEGAEVIDVCKAVEEMMKRKRRTRRTQDACEAGEKRPHYNRAGCRGC